MINLVDACGNDFYGFIQSRFDGINSFASSGGECHERVFDTYGPQEEVGLGEAKAG